MLGFNTETLFHNSSGLQQLERSDSHLHFVAAHIWFSKTSCSPTILATEMVTICPTADADIDSSASGINSANTCQQTHASQSQAPDSFWQLKNRTMKIMAPAAAPVPSGRRCRKVSTKR